MSIRDTWATPPDFWAFVKEGWGPTLDICASPENTKCPLFITKEQDAFTYQWPAADVVWCNPPGSEVARWVQLCAERAKSDNRTILCLVQAGVGLKWFYEYSTYADTLLLTPRPQFIPPKGIRASSNARDYMLMVFDQNPTSNAWPCRWK